MIMVFLFVLLVNHINYIFIIFICNNKNILKIKQNYAEISKKILKTFFLNFYKNINNIFCLNHLLFTVFSKNKNMMKIVLRKVK